MRGRGGKKDGVMKKGKENSRKERDAGKRRVKQECYQEREGTEVWKSCFAWKLCKHTSNSVCCKVLPECMEFSLRDSHFMWCVHPHIHLHRLHLWLM